ncbi:MAG: hypothetical protein GY796_27245 [Chloroflexi bacterium]|nr:hypothetical protein [Chloroflexota bacterium]
MDEKQVLTCYHNLPTCESYYTDPKAYIDSTVLGHSGLTSDQSTRENSSFGNDWTVTNPYWATSDGGSPVALTSIIDTNLETNGAMQVHTPIVGSPAIGHGDAAVCADAPINGLDQRGAARPYGGTCDAGAVELQEAIQSCSLSTGNNSFDFSGSDDAAININTMGDLDCVQVEKVPLLHPEVSAAFTENRWWHIAARNSSGALASGFDADLTLPDSETTPIICKYPGGLGGSGWDCTGTQVDNGGTVTRQGISSFSDWAVSNDAGPTAVSLQSLSTQTPPTGIVAGLLAGITAVTVGLWRRLRQQEDNARE